MCKDACNALSSWSNGLMPSKLRNKKNCHKCRKRGYPDVHKRSLKTSERNTGQIFVNNIHCLKRRKKIVRKPMERISSSHSLAPWFEQFVAGVARILKNFQSYNRTLRQHAPQQVHWTGVSPASRCFEHGLNTEKLQPCLDAPIIFFVRYNQTLALPSLTSRYRSSGRED